jgi:hypothetical protein
MENTRRLLDDSLALSKADNKSVDKINNEEEQQKTVNALSSVINFIITDAFNLKPEESMWVAYHLGQILEPLKHIKSDALLGAVQRELDCGEYSKRMFKRDSDIANNTADIAFSTGVRYAPVSDWVEGISEIVLGSYTDLRPMIQSSIVGSIHGLFLELGVGDNPRKSRASSYLPNAVRFLLGTVED